MQEHGKILLDREMITPEKREILKSLGLRQLHIHDTPYFGPDVDYDALDLIPSNQFNNKLQGGIEVIYDEHRDRMLIFDKDQKYMNGHIDDGKPYNWETGLERLKKLLDEKKDSGD